MIIIGEKINATRKSITEAIDNRDADAIAPIAKAQDEAGADVIDVNAGSGKENLSEEIEDIRWLVDIVEKVTEKPLAVDSENPGTMSAGLEAISGPTPWINLVSAEAERLEKVLPLVKKYGSPVISLCLDDNGIPADIDGRIKAAGAIYEAGTKLGIEPELFYFDPLVMPIGTDREAGNIILETIEGIKKNFPGVKTAVGLSNVSFGLPQREVLNFSFLVLCMGVGLDAAILDPTNDRVMMVLRAADALLGNDDFCINYIGQHRKGKDEVK